MIQNFWVVTYKCNTYIFCMFACWLTALWQFCQISRCKLLFFMWYLCKSVSNYSGYWYHGFIFIQLNRSASSIKAAAELVIDNHVMRFKGQASQTKLGFKQALELYHSLPQVQMKFSSIDTVIWSHVDEMKTLSYQYLWLTTLFLDYFISVSVQLMSVPSSLVVQTGYAGHNGSHVLTHHTQWRDENTTAPKGLQQWKSRQIGTSVIIN